MPALPTGFPVHDAQDDSSRARRRQAIRLMRTQEWTPEVIERLRAES